MGLFTPSTPPTPKPAEPKIAPTRSQRARCWEARDGFFRCLDEHGIVDAIKNADAAKASCRSKELQFEKECVGSWVRPPLPIRLG